MKKLILASLPLLALSACERPEPRERAAERMEQEGAAVGAQPGQMQGQQPGQMQGQQPGQMQGGQMQGGQMQGGQMGQPGQMGGQMQGQQGGQMGAQQGGQQGQLAEPIIGVGGQAGGQQGQAGAQASATASSQKLQQAATALQNDQSIPMNVKRGVQIGVVEDRIVLRGNVPDQKMKDAIEQRVKEFGEVDNQLVVSAEGGAAQ